MLGYSPDSICPCHHIPWRRPDEPSIRARNGVRNLLRWTGCAWSGSLAGRWGLVGVHVVGDGDAHVAARALRGAGLGRADRRGTRPARHAAPPRPPTKNEDPAREGNAGSPCPLPFPICACGEAAYPGRPSSAETASPARARPRCLLPTWFPMHLDRGRPASRPPEPSGQCH